MRQKGYSEEPINTICISCIKQRLCKKCRQWCLRSIASITYLKAEIKQRSGYYLTLKSINKLLQVGWWKQWFTVPGNGGNNRQAAHCNSSIKWIRDLIQRTTHAVKRIDSTLFPLGREGKRMASELLRISAIACFLYLSETIKSQHVSSTPNWDAY